MATETTRRPPAIVPQHPNWFRVMRVFRVGTDPVEHECIAEFSESGPAVTFASQQKDTRCHVSRWDSRRIYDNGRPIEVREAAPRPTTRIPGGAP